MPSSRQPSQQARNAAGRTYDGNCKDGYKARRTWHCDAQSSVRIEKINSGQGVRISHTLGSAYVTTLVSGKCPQTIAGVRRLVHDKAPAYAGDASEQSVPTGNGIFSSRRVDLPAARTSSLVACARASVPSDRCDISHFSSMSHEFSPNDCTCRERCYLAVIPAEAVFEIWESEWQRLDFLPTMLELISSIGVSVSLSCLGWSARRETGSRLDVLTQFRNAAIRPNRPLPPGSSQKGRWPRCAPCAWYRHATRRTPCQCPFWEERISRLLMK